MCAWLCGDCDGFGVICLMSDVWCMCSVMVGLLLLWWCACVVLAAMVCFLLFDVWCMFKSSSMLLRCSSLFVPCACSFWLWLASQACGVLAESQEPAFFRLRWQTLASIFFDEQAKSQKLACSRLASILAEKVEWWADLFHYAAGCVLFVSNDD